MILSTFPQCVPITFKMAAVLETTFRKEKVATQPRGAYRDIFEVDPMPLECDWRPYTES